MKQPRPIILDCEEFWSFSLAFYSVTKNQKSLLCLQDSALMNINLALLVLYCGVNKFSLNRLEINTLRNSIKELDSLTLNLRVKRRAYKESQLRAGVLNYKDKNYKTLLSQELSLEKQQQSILIQTVNAFELNKNTSAIDIDAINLWVFETLHALTVCTKVSDTAIKAWLNALLLEMTNFVGQYACNES